MFTEAVLRSWKGQIDVEHRANRMKVRSDQTLDQIYLNLIIERARQVQQRELREQEQQQEEEPVE